MASKLDNIDVVLIETAAHHSKGSMSRYANLIAEAMRPVTGFQIHREVVASDKRSSLPLPSVIKTLLHHSTCWRSAKRIATKYPRALFHIVDGSHGYLANRFPRHRLIITVHDVIPALQARGFFPVPPPSRAAQWIIKTSLNGLKCAQFRIHDSERTRDDYRNLSKNSVEQESIIYPPLEPSFLAKTEPETTNSGAEVSQATNPYILHIGNNGFYKNRHGVVEIFALLANRIPHTLVMAGPRISDSLKNRLEELKLSRRVRLIESPDDAEVKQLYRRADALLFPSLYEGFGWPPLEAMACNCPVICSNAGSLREVVGDAALVCDPTDYQDFANQIERVLCDAKLSHELRKKGKVHCSQFTLDQFAAQLTRVYREVAEHR